MPKTPSTPNDPRSPRLQSPYKRSRNEDEPKEQVSPFPTPDPETKAEARAAIPPPLLLKRPQATVPDLAVASDNPAQKTFYYLSGNFLRSGVYCFSKSGKHAIDNPLDNTGACSKQARWLMVQFNVVVKEESTWACEVAMHRHGGLLVAREMLQAVQSGGEAASRRGGKFQLTLRPPLTTNDPEDDPRIAISFFFDFTPKLYMQALDGTMPYSFLLVRVTKTDRKRDKVLRFFR